jgi:hypothetical protein
MGKTWWKLKGFDAYTMQKKSSEWILELFAKEKNSGNIVHGMITSLDICNVGQPLGSSMASQRRDNNLP